MIMNPTENKQKIADAFSAAAATYDQAAYVEQEIGSRLLDRLSCIKIQPLRILDLGCGTGYFTQRLRTLFPQAAFIGMDLAFGMVNYASKKQAVVPELNYCCADAEHLPFADKAFDLIFSNCCFMATNNLESLSKELQRVLAKDGLLLFTTLGPDTLKEFSLTDNWLDMHHIGDLFVQAQFANPVVDAETLTFTYSQLNDLLQDLQETGNYEIADRTQIAKLHEPCSATFEVIYGHAWGRNVSQTQYTDAHGQVYIPIDQITYLKT